MTNLKVGSKVRLTCNAEGFLNGQVVEVYRLGTSNTSSHLFKGKNSQFANCDGEEGAWLWPFSYEVVPESPRHPHADLMLKYAQLAQYDDKPWEQFECSSLQDSEWIGCVGAICFYNNVKYRLKPQAPVIQLGQVWVSLSNGQEVQVFRKPYPSEGGCGVVEKWVIGVVLDESINLATSVVISELDLTSHFKRKV